HRLVFPPSFWPTCFDARHNRPIGWHSHSINFSVKSILGKYCTDVATLLVLEDGLSEEPDLIRQWYNCQSNKLP
ncbi:hypothetical protein SKAU_G00204040, partial [Synaphobranchus kaupii]